ncbi:MAG TPA: phospholipid carrier-dependent glycosyltransferase [Casimicrobiaceae bacterium]
MSITLSRAVVAALAIVMALVWFANLGERQLQHPDEGRYAEIAREMTVTGDWVTPRLDGIKYFEKPPLQYWLTAATFDAFGVSDASARLSTAIAGLLTVLAVGATGAMIATPSAGLLAGAVLASSVWHFGIAHILTLDAMLSFWLAVALCAFLLAQRASPSRRACAGWMLTAWTAAALGVLTKGVVALAIPACALAVYSLATRDFGPWRRLHLGKGLVVLLAIAAPWFVVVSLRNPEFPRFFFIHEHVERFLTTKLNRPGPWWYFLPMVVVGTLPWTGVLVARVRAAWRDGAVGAVGGVGDAIGSRAFAWPRFCLAWAAFVLVFFSISGSKLPSYILPMFPALALVLGWQLALMPGRVLAWLALFLAASTLALWIAALVGYPHLASKLGDARTPHALYVALGPWIDLGLGIASAGYALGAFLLWRDRDAGRGLGAALHGPGSTSTPVASPPRMLAVAAIAIATMLAMQAFFQGSDVFRATRSAADLVATLEKRADPPYDRSAPFYQVRMYDQTLPFYLRRTTTVVAWRDELGPGIDLEPSLAIASVDTWASRWRTLSQGYALMSPDTWAALNAEHLPMTVVARDSRRVLVERRGANSGD